MMTSALVLIAAILLLGGLLAALGDYLGTKIGKARLRLFNLRPRQTATFITIFTGTLIAASTLGILFATSASLRKGIFQLDEYLNRLQETREQLSEAREQKQKVEQQLAQAEQEQAQVEQDLDEVNSQFQLAQEELDQVSQKVADLKQQLKSLKQERENLLAQRDSLEQEIVKRDQKLSNQKKELKTKQQELQQAENRLDELEQQRRQLQGKIEKQDEKIAELDKIIRKRNEVLQFQEEKVSELETTIKNLQKEKEILQDNYQELRQGNVALVKGEVLSFNVVSVPEKDLTKQVIHEILRQANKHAIEATQPGKENLQKQIIKITEAQVKRMKEMLRDGEEYVVQIISAGNYLTGEEKIRVFADVIPNQKVFKKGEVIASLSLNPQQVKNGKLSERIDSLLAASKFRARRSGMVGDILISKDRRELINFMEKVASLEQPYDKIDAMAASSSYSSGPLELKFVVKQQDQVILSN